MGKKHKIVKCRKCGCNNDVTAMIDNSDIEYDSKRDAIYIYCIQCGNQFEVEY